MEERSSTEDGELVIDMTLSDDEASMNQTDKANGAENPLEPKIYLEVPEVNADVPTALEASSMPGEPMPSNANPILGSLLSDCPSADVLVPQEGSAAPAQGPNLLGILGNYTPSDLARVTTQAMIECIARFPALWDSHEPSYHNHKYCGLLWKNIAVVLNMHVKRAKNKWYSLRSAYRKEYFKSKETGIPSRFAYFQALSFLEAETLRGKERSDFEKSKLIKILANKNIPVNGLNEVSIDLDDDDDDCMIVENLEDCSSGSTTTVASEYLSAKSIAKAIEDKPDQTPSDSKTIPWLVNGKASTDEQARPAFFIRPKNISELMPPLEPANASDAGARSPSPEIVFLSEKAHSISKVPQLIVSDAFPASAYDSFNDKDSAPVEIIKTNLENEMRSSVKRILSKNAHPPPKKVKMKSKLQKIPNGGVSEADTTALRFLKEPHGLPKVDNETAGPLKKMNGTALGKRVSGMAPSSDKLTKKPSLSSLESTKGNDRPRNLHELTEVNKGFLLSLLPDVEGMTNTQFRTFKKQATAIVSMILDRS